MSLRAVPGQTVNLDQSWTSRPCAEPQLGSLFPVSPSDLEAAGKHLPSYEAREDGTDELKQEAPMSTPTSLLYSSQWGLAVTSGLSLSWIFAEQDSGARAWLEP